MLIVGATGYVGRHVVADACRQGHEVVAHVRPGSPSGPGDRAAAQLVAMGARVVRTAWVPEAWVHLLESEQPERVFLLLGTTKAREKSARSSGGPDVSQRAVDLGLTTLVIGATRVASPDTGLVYLSALGASATGNAYLRVRATVEAALVSGPNPFTVVRPSFITGPDREEARPVERVGAMAGDALCALLRLVGARGPASRLASITGADLARILVELASGPLDRRVHALDDFRH
ncbi:MAG: NAD-dependent epimerase/dehydratase family protein [Gemmatimonadaceae bacterium]|nr:NAD-dependent epimerase/dehydratase family protein [Gemmatimonadaceae bacterium]